jgi:hypothetical protein
MHSRDELRSRSPEQAPAWRMLENGLRACWPTDTDAGGTWVGVREDGFYLGLVNLNASDEELDADRPQQTHISRGELIPMLMECVSVAEAVELVTSADLRGMKPFRVLMVGPSPEGGFASAIARFGGSQVTLPAPFEPVVRPRCLASSGLGDHLVQCRLPLFREMVVPDPSPENQRAFHFHQWPDRLEYSVLMSRENARTASVTSVEFVSGELPNVVYESVAEACPEADPVGSEMLQ